MTSRGSPALRANSGLDDRIPLGFKKRSQEDLNKFLDFYEPEGGMPPPLLTSEIIVQDMDEQVMNYDG
jgi:hypothetical protein